MLQRPAENNFEPSRYGILNAVHVLAVRTSVAFVSVALPVLNHSVGLWIVVNFGPPNPVGDYDQEPVPD